MYTEKMQRIPTQVMYGRQHRKTLTEPVNPRKHHWISNMTPGLLATDIHIHIEIFGEIIIINNKIKLRFY